MGISVNKSTGKDKNGKNTYSAGSYKPSRNESKLGIDYRTTNQSKKDSSNKVMRNGSTEPKIATDEYIIGADLALKAKQQQDLQENISPSDPSALFQVNASLSMALQGTATLTSYLLPTDAFIFDHPVYGQWDTNYAFDGGYQTYPDTYTGWDWGWNHSWGVQGGFISSVLYTTSF
jgi:hypothetical protein